MNDDSRPVPGRDPRVYTMHAWGRTTHPEAHTPEELAGRLYTRTHWLYGECLRLAEQLWRGHIVAAWDYELMIIPGRFAVTQDRPAERELVGDVA